MKIVKYPMSLQWVGAMQCPCCSKITLSWQSSGMSMCFPHFYCTKCSNVIHRQKDQILVYNEKSQKLLEEIAKDLPDCKCGGHFEPGTNPKCAHCGHDFPHPNAPVTRLHDPHMIVTNGSCVYNDKGLSYKVVITE